VGGIGAIGAALVLRGRRRPGLGADPAAELRRRLASARSGAEPLPAQSLATPQAPAAERAEPEPPAPREPWPADVESRRRDVHARARAAVEEMRGAAPAGGEAEESP
jgi:hypothetical protein